MTGSISIRGLKASDVWNYENAFFWFSDTRRIGKLIAHYELYKKILSLPGEVFELGVYKGASLLRFATFRELLEAPHSRRIVAFDAFGVFPRIGVGDSADNAFIDKFEDEGGEGLSIEQITAVLKYKGIEKNIDLVKGDIRDSLPTYLDRVPACRIALLHLDMDVYEPTKLALELLWNKIVPGGIIVIDDYNAVPGATRATDEFVLRNNIPMIEKLACSHVPSFITKKR